jgi:5S rRNA maturation endonuclease (ribonuclease M5)
MKVLCPNHEDTNPSMYVYPERAYCFVCNFSCPSEEVLNGEEIQKLKKEPEDIQETIRYIKTLRKVYHRKLEFYSNGQGYYIIWPNGSYYKFRRYTGDTRYYGPVGHKTPLFVLKDEGYKTLFIVEGEINALSFKQAYVQDEWTVCSPGSATELPRHLEFYLRFNDIYVIVDKDPAGVVWGLKLKNELLSRGKKVQLVALEKDLNDIWQETGKEGIEETLRKEGLDLSKL